jgi:hypothetical protein
VPKRDSFLILILLIIVTMSELWEISQTKKNGYGGGTCCLYVCMDVSVCTSVCVLSGPVSLEC